MSWQTLNAAIRVRSVHIRGLSANVHCLVVVQPAEFAEYKIEHLLTLRRTTGHLNVRSKEPEIDAAGEDPAAENLKREVLGRLQQAREKA